MVEDSIYVNYWRRTTKTTTGNNQSWFDQLCWPSLTNLIQYGSGRNTMWRLPKNMCLRTDILIAESYLKWYSSGSSSRYVLLEMTDLCKCNDIMGIHAEADSSYMTSFSRSHFSKARARVPCYGLKTLSLILSPREMACQ